MANAFKDWTPERVMAHNRKFGGVVTTPEQSLRTVKNPSITITGQIRGGKNNMIVTRTGLHFPKASWAKWRDEKVSEVKAQLPDCFKFNGVDVRIRLDYYAGDLRRRDQPAIIDAIFHVLEKAGFVDDDTHIWVAESSRQLDRENPRAEIFILK